mmetsp:Transcript_19267/g.50565  ORF Transcript_19267/g.50565 Transcript_19267/m.50565 type:complete len:285 (-) Transcript_19267:339-1193(-)
MIGLALSSVCTVACIGLGRHDSPIQFTGGPGFLPSLKGNGERSFVPFPSVPLSFIKALKDAAGRGFTVNDVLLAVTSGVLRRHCELVGDEFLRKGGESCGGRFVNRALIAVAFPRSEEETNDPARAMRNNFCFVPAEMPVRLEDTVERLKFVQRDMSNLKRSPTAPLAQCVLNNVVGGCCTPRPLQQKFGYDAVARATVIFSNVPGPQEPFCFGGQQITGLQMIFPNLPPQVGILSMNGKVFFNFVLDPNVVKQSELLPKLYVDELADLADRLKVEMPPTSSWS